MCQQAGREGETERREAVGGVEQVLVAAPERDVQVVARSLVVRERLGHEARQQPVAGCDVLDHLFQQERAVRGVERLAVREVDLELARRELAVRRRRPQAEGLECLVDAPHHAVGIDATPRRVGLARAGGVALDVTVGKLAQQVELGLGGGDGVQPARFELPDDAPQRAARAERRWRAVVDEVGEQPGRRRVPRGHARGRELGARLQVGEALTAGKRGIHQRIALQRLDQAGRAVGEPARRHLQAAEGEIFRARATERVGVHHADEAHASLGELRRDGIGCHGIATLTFGILYRDSCEEDG